MPNQPDLDPTVVIPLPQRTLAALDALENAGFETWIVGGYVRDALLGRPSSDIDIATQAHWQDVQRVFEGQGYRTHETGTAHGTLTVIVDEQALEVTTYRSDGAYADARHPNQVSFVRTIAEDLARRDFTMNALAYHPARGLFDPYGGHADLEARIIRAVGDPDRRFSEDALRMLRACRFAAELGFAIDPNTFEGMLANKGLLPRISTERITHELQRLLLGEHAGRALTATVDVLAAVLPELVAMKGFEQRTPYHIYDVLEHTARVLDGVPPYPLVRWAALFHDMGKPAAFFTDEDGTGHFYGHAAISVMLARGIMGRLALSSAFAAQVLTLVERHDDVIDRTPKAVKRALSRLGGNVELFAALCDLKRGDARGQAPRCIDRVSDADELERILSEILAADEAFSLKKLAIDGRDVIELGVPQGPLVGLALSDALDAVMDERIDNEACALRAFIEEWRAEHEDRAPL
ncbi:MULTISPECIES: CCA tRNA nucleotidyltransferase [unclassified Eggerthella]|uniref:CCA tRNA nucleotidyltransferase n=1 Tax=unclassified Eggerthella TaxID=2648737 RepID=UPI00136A1144|nr:MULTISPECIES: HD domain-containing protein [unclassified Eggerthella]MZJ94430.1 HD domain-containing protein [Eggerthella sp. BIOML-A3]MZJ98512.1 HD domain-containing protein [Eggerthella sp. BIOML-A1]MZK37096.1 HD domain-containing protein [Eggerthella sp. BIOML-A5]